MYLAEEIDPLAITIPVTIYAMMTGMEHTASREAALVNFGKTRVKRKVQSKLVKSVATKAAAGQFTRHAGVRMAGRFATRAIPVVGWAMLVYDINELRKQMSE